MLILLDHGTPAPLRLFLTGHTVKKAKELGWDTLTNGELLRAAEAASFQVFITTDKNIRYQQNLSEHAIAIVVLGIPQMANPASARGPRRGRGKCCKARHLPGIGAVGELWPDHSKFLQACPLGQFSLENQGQRNRVARPANSVFWQQSEVQCMRRFEFKEGSSSKFWEATLSDNKLTVCYGRIGSPGQEKSNTFPRPEFAKKEHDKLIADKLRKGYKEVAASEAGPSAAKSKSATDILGALKQCEPLKRVAKQLESLQRLSLRITTKAVKGTSEGASKLGGRPDLPAGISWPIGKVAGREIALPFIAQFDVAWLWRSYIGPGAIGLLPTSGMLYFFYNMADYGADYLAPENWRVIYHPSGDKDSLAPSEPPMPIPPHLDYKARAARFQTELTLPNIETCYIGVTGDTTARVELTEEEWNAYIELRSEFRADKNIHQMFGHADDVQPYALENSYASVRDVFFPDGRPFKSLTPKEQAEEFFQGRLLLQIDEEKSSKMQFGRGGRLYFFIREQDLKARDFSKVWVNEQ